MCPALKNSDWAPSASLNNLKARAQLIANLRQFFDKRSVLEVETPLLCSRATTDPFIRPITVNYSLRSGETDLYYLQSSPEFAMKRLLAAGSGPIYQICKAFRYDEVGRLHNPEFTMLEWYQPGFDHHQLMDEVEDLLKDILNIKMVTRIAYEALFQEHLFIDPHRANKESLKNCAIASGISLTQETIDTLSERDWLDLLMSHCIQPKLGFDNPVMVFDYPVSMAALAKIRPVSPAVAERFEVYMDGIELANGYHELTDPKKQRARFLEDNKIRSRLGYPLIPFDERLLEALEAGLPSSAGVALGVDRLLLLKLKDLHIRNIVSFTVDRV